MTSPGDNPLPDLVLRPATRDDCADIARLFLISSDGLADYIWSRIAEPGEELFEAGARRYAREGVPFSYENCLMAELDGAVVGMAHMFAMEEDPDAEPETDPVLKPYADLEAYGSLYLSGIAVFDTHRNRGIGGRLLDAVEEKARAASLPSVSLICFERNEAAMRLYERIGYRDIARRPLVPHPSLHYQDGDAVLMLKTL